MFAGFITFLGGLLRAAPYIICFLIGWQAKTTLVELKVAKTENAALKEAQDDLAQYQKNYETISEKYKNLREEFNREACNRILTDCATRKLDRLFAQ